MSKRFKERALVLAEIQRFERGPLAISLLNRDGPFRLPGEQVVDHERDLHDATLART